MAKHTVYVGDSTERLLVELFGESLNYSELVQQALVRLIADQPERKVARAIARISKQQVSATAAELRASLGLDSGQNGGGS